MSIIQPPKTPPGLDLSPNALSKKSQHDKIVAATEEVLEVLVKRDCSVEEVYQILGGAENAMQTYFKSRKLSDVKAFFTTK